MFFRNSSNNNSASVNTRLTQFYSQQNAVTLSAWNNNISIRIQPYIGTDSAGIRQYENSKDKCVTTSITPDNAILLANGIYEKVIPAIKEGTKKSVSIVISANSSARKILTIGFDGTDSYLELAVNVAENGSCPADSIITHTFSKKSYIEDYEPMDGTGNEIVAHAELIRFAEKLKNIDLIGGAIAHGIKYADVAKSSFVSGGNQYNSGSVQQSSEPVKPQYSAPTQEYSGESLNDLLPFD